MIIFNRMDEYNNNQIVKRTKFLQSHKKLGCYLNSNIINILVNLFDITNDSTYKIVDYIDNERKKRDMDTNVTVVSEIYGEDNDNSTLYLGIRKNNKDFIHLTIHLCLDTLNSDKHGMIHIRKNVFKNRKLLSSRKFKKFGYALISVENPENKPNSLIFSIADGITTPGVKHEFICDDEIKKEMDVIITVLNRLFDENDPDYYIGNKNKLFPIHNKTNAVLNNINRHTEHFTRKNKGSRMGPVESTEPMLNHKRNRKKSFRAIREERFKKSLRFTRKTNKVVRNKSYTHHNNTVSLSSNNYKEVNTQRNDYSITE